MIKKKRNFIIFLLLYSLLLVSSYVIWKFEILLILIKISALLISLLGCFVIVYKFVENIPED